MQRFRPERIPFRHGSKRLRMKYRSGRLRCALSRSNKDLIKKGLAAGAALLVLRVVYRRFRKGDSSYDEGLNRIASSISREITRNLKAGMPEREAVETALRKRPPVLRFGEGTAGTGSSGALKLLIKQLAVSLSPVIVETILDVLRQGQNRSSDEGRAR